MRDKPGSYLEQKRITKGKMTSSYRDGFNGQFAVWHKKIELLVQASNGKGWEHVSVSRRGSNNNPSWGDMCFVKGLFWKPDECVIQYHPAEANYINDHPGCLHMWRPIGQDVPMPPTNLVGLGRK